MLRLLPKSRVSYQIKMIRPKWTLASYKFTFKSEFFSTWAPLPNPKEMKASLSKVQALKFILEMATYSKSCVFPNLKSLAARFTEVSKRLGREHCCDTTLNRCLEHIRHTIFAWIKNNHSSTFKSEGFGGIPRFELYQIKLTLASYKFTFKSEFFSTWAPSSWNFVIHSSNYTFKTAYFTLQSSNFIF